MSESAIRVVGLNDFRKGLRGMDRGLPKTVRGALNEAAETLVAATRPKVPSRSGAARASLRAQSTQTTARVAVGGRKAPYYPWLDFGGKTGRKKSVVRPFFKQGRYIFPTLAEKRDAIQQALLEALTGLAAANGIEVS
jgi:hypothetical protein